jgi:hypothetical protein
MKFSYTARPLLAAAPLAMALALTPLSAQQPPERVDLDAIYKIKQEGFQNSKVMDIMSWLTDVYGPRLTNSPGFRKSGDWAVKEMTSWGLTNVKLEPFGPFGRGWANEFIQDPVEYNSRTHHSNMDVYERIQESDMRQNAVIVAAFVYHAANREDKLPGKPLPPPQGAGRGTAGANR